MENLLIVQKQNTEIPKDIVYGGKIHWMSYCIPVIQSFRSYRITIIYCYYRIFLR
jgi:hypothetical protein